MNVEPRLNIADRKTEDSREKSIPVPLCQQKIPTDLGVNPGLHGERLVASHLSHMQPKHSVRNYV
jgi:hypothetical protein